MPDYKDSLEVFIQEMKKSTVYTEYMLQRDNLRKYPELKKQVDDYRQKNFVLQTQTYPELKKQVDDYRQKNFVLQTQTYPDQLFDEIDRFQKEYEEFRENPVVHDFLAAELAFCRMMQNIHLKLVDAVAFEFE